MTSAVTTGATVVMTVAISAASNADETQMSKR